MAVQASDDFADLADAASPNGRTLNNALGGSGTRTWSGNPEGVDSGSLLFGAGDDLRVDYGSAADLKTKISFVLNGTGKNWVAFGRGPSSGRTSMFGALLVGQTSLRVAEWDSGGTRTDRATKAITSLSTTTTYKLEFEINGLDCTARILNSDDSLYDEVSYTAAATPGGTQQFWGFFDLSGSSPSVSRFDDPIIQDLASGGATLTPSLFTNTQTFHAPTVGRGAVGLTPSLFTNTQTFHAATVSASYGLTPALLTNTNTFYAATVGRGAVTLTPALFTNSQTFYAATVANGFSLAPSLLTNTQTFYGPTVTVGAVTLAPDLFSNDNTFFGATITGGAVEAPARTGGGWRSPKTRRRKFLINGEVVEAFDDEIALIYAAYGLLEQEEKRAQPQSKKKKNRPRKVVPIPYRPGELLGDAVAPVNTQILPKAIVWAERVVSKVNPDTTEDDEWLIMMAA